MFKIIGKLQQQPESTRRRVALFASGVIVFFIALVWVSTFNERLKKDAGEAVSRNENSPFTVFREQFGELKTLFVRALFKHF